MSFNIEVEGGKTVKLPTAGKYCDRDILVTAAGGGATPKEQKDVNFYDYDGTLLHSYTLSEIQGLSELPALPDHTADGLICQGWSWSLEDLKAYAKPNDILPYYTTDDGATWYDIVNDTGHEMTVTFAWRQYTSLGVPVLDFGDGSETFKQETIATEGEVVSVSHTYSQGEFRAKLIGMCNLGTVNAVRDISDTESVLLRRVFLGFGHYLYSYSFRNCYRLETCTVPQRCTVAAAGIFVKCYSLVTLLVNHKKENMGASIISSCSALRVVSIPNGAKTWYGSGDVRSIKRVCIPDTLTALSSSINDAHALAYFHIPNGLTAIPASFMLRNYSLTTIDLPSSVTSIGANAFGSCSGLATLRFNPTTPPTVANANAFTGIPASCVVEVPAASLTAYQNATNYSGIAAQMVGV